MRTLSASLARALDGQGGFRMGTATARVTAPPLLDWERYRGRLVFWPLHNTCEAVWLLLAALRAGVVPVLLPPHLPQAKRTALRTTYARFGELVEREIVCPADAVTADARLFMVFLTSGSTGQPKLLAATENALQAGVTTMRRVQALQAVASTAILLPLHFAFAFVNQLLWALHYERKIILTAGTSLPAEALRELRETRAGMVCLVSQQARMLVDLGFAASTCLPDMQVANLGGGPFPSHQFDVLRQLFPAARIINNYGCTEALTRVASCEVTSANHQVTDVGRPFPGLDVRIAGAELLGPIEFRGPSVSSGLVLEDGRIEAHPKWIASGDLGRFEGEDLHVLGRHDQIFKRGGERLSLIEIEQILLALPKVNQVVAWARRKENSEEYALAIMHGSSVPVVADLRRHLKVTLPPNAWPSQIFWAAHWPLLPNGKPDRALLQTMAETGELGILWTSLRDTA